MPGDASLAAARPTITLPDLAVTTLRFELRAAGRVELPGWLGSTLHGAVAAALKRRCCPPGCAARHAERPCAYARLLEPPPAPRGVPPRLAAMAPLPFVLRPPAPGPARVLRDGEPLDFALALIGRAGDESGAVMAAVEEAGRRGLGRGRGRLALARVAIERGPLAPAAAGGRVTVRTVTPLRLYERGKLVREPGLAELAAAAARRLEALDAFHGAAAMSVAEETLQDVLAGAAVERAAWAPFHVTRFSSRQDRRHPMDGVTGECTVTGASRDLALLLRAAAAAGIGKAATFGFGSIEVAEGGGSVASE
jgi:hypothetical protein